MTKEEFISAHEEEEQRHEDRMRIIDREYALSNNPVKVGDIIEDHCTKIRVDKVLFRRCFDYKRDTSSCAYKGTKLKKDGTPTKIPKVETVYQYNVKSINGVPYDKNK